MTGDNFEIEMAKLIQRYLKEVELKEYEIEEIMQRPRWKRVWFWWKALERYEGKEFPEDLTLDEVRRIYGS